MCAPEELTYPTSYSEQGITNTGYRKKKYEPNEGEKCWIFDKDNTKPDSTSVIYYEKKQSNGISYATGEIEVEKCSISADILSTSPFVKFMSMLLAVLIALLVVCGCFICCSYFKLENRYSQLNQTV